MIYKKSDNLEIISNLKSSKNNATTKDQHIYYLIKHYQVLEIAGIEYLIKKSKEENSYCI